MQTRVFSELIVTGIQSVCRVHLPAPMRCSPRQNRPYGALYLKQSGRTTYQSGKSVFVSDPNHLLFLPKGSSYQVFLEEPGECLRLEFDTVQTGGDILSIPVADTAELQHRMTRLESLWLFKRPAYLPKALSEVYGMLAQLDELTHSAYLPSPKHRLLQPALDYLQAHCADPSLRISQLSQAAGLSETYFRRLFHEAYHASPIQYLRAMRVSRAQAILSGEFASIESVAAATGFSSVYHFCKTFRQLTGQTPGAYAASRLRSEAQEPKAR